MKKIVCLVMIVVFLTSLSIPSFAFQASTNSTVPENVHEAISFELSLYEQHKDLLGVSNIDFSKLLISERLPVYEYLPTGFNPLTNAYLLFQNEKAVILAYEAEENIFQLMPKLAMEIEQSNVHVRALVYDASNCYVYDGNKLHLLYTFAPRPNENRGVIVSSKDDSYSALATGNSQNRFNLQYQTSRTSRSAYVTCSVPFVTQNPYDSICWAACVAMITNKLTGTSLTAPDVAQALFGSTNFNQMANTLQARNMLSYYGVTYTIYSSENSTENLILTNLQNQYPIYGSFMIANSSYGHSCVIYGINVLAGRLLIQDPEIGNNTCYYNGNGKFCFVVNGHTYVLSQTICKI